MPAVGTRILCAWRDGQHYPAEVIDRRLPKQKQECATRKHFKKDSGAPEDDLELYEYYVHYEQFNKRLDEWVTHDRIKLVSTSEAKTRESERIDAGSQPASLKTRRGARPGLKRKLDTSAPEDKSTSHDHVLAPTTNTKTCEQETLTKVKNIQLIELGKYEIDCWYYSPYPEEYSEEEKLYICEFCLKYMKRKETLTRHKQSCTPKSPPGVQIYEEGNLRMFEIEGKIDKVYCQNLCLLSKLFLDHKTLYYDVNPFLFYVLCEADEEGSHLVGYFSKEKDSPDDYNLACILTFPPYQRSGYGKLLISISYELSKREKKVGSPEKPLSDLGKLSYRSYWTYVLLNLLKDYKGNLSIKQISNMTSIKTEDIVSTLQSLNLVHSWRGQHVVIVAENIINNQLSKARPLRLVNPRCLSWAPKNTAKPAGARQIGTERTVITSIMLEQHFLSDGQPMPSVKNAIETDSNTYWW